MTPNELEFLKIQYAITETMIPEGHCIRHEQAKQIQDITWAVVACFDKLIDDKLVELVTNWKAECAKALNPEHFAENIPLDRYIASRITLGD